MLLLVHAPLQVGSTVAAIKRSAGRELMFTVLRGPDLVDVPCVPDIGNDGLGRIGVQLNSNIYIKHVKPQNVGEVFKITGSEFNR